MNDSPLLRADISRVLPPLLALLLGYSVLQAGEPTQSDKSSVNKSEGSKGGNAEPSNVQGKSLDLSAVISWREEHIRRLIKEMDSNKDKPGEHWDHRINMVTRSLVQLRAIEAVPALCEQITVRGGDGKHILPAAEALTTLGGSALPGIYRSLEETPKSYEEIKLFAFVLRAIDQREELTVFRLETEMKHRTEETERNATFKENARKLLKCFATPDFFRFENSPFYGH